MLRNSTHVEDSRGRRGKELSRTVRKTVGERIPQELRLQEEGETKLVCPPMDMSLSTQGYPATQPHREAPQMRISLEKRGQQASRVLPLCEKPELGERFAG